MDNIYSLIPDCKTFMEMFQEVAESQGKKEESEDASAAAGLLEKLSVGDSKTEDKGQEEGSLATKEKVAVDKEEVQAEADKKDETESPA
ncbi:hypothetical protein CK203_047356 [Vitis vinifera]|uniref:Uncharacterized protein n=1 Tax=Vitis vinifera TaxID=29760 RepID=A0A438HHQ7_VITVI|nr:hypothetical protein CK203_047356 [Vitis vinifera]